MSLRAWLYLPLAIGLYRVSDLRARRGVFVQQAERAGHHLARDAECGPCARQELGTSVARLFGLLGLGLWHSGLLLLLLLGLRGWRGWLGGLGCCVHGHGPHCRK